MFAGRQNEELSDTRIELLWEAVCPCRYYVELWAVGLSWQEHSPLALSHS